MTCQESLGLYSEYLDGGLPEEIRERFEVHLARCASCARYHRVLRKGLGLVQELRPVEPSADFEQRLQHRIFHLLDERAQPRRLRGPGTALSIAAVGLFALAIWRPLSDGARAFETLPVAETIEDAEGIGHADAWFVGTPPAYMDPGAQPSLSLAFPGPYSPLIVEPPLRTGARFTSFRLE